MVMTFFLKLPLYGYYMVQFLAKSIKRFRIYRKIKYLTFDYDLWPWGQGHNILLFYFIFIRLLYGANFSKIGQAVYELSLFVFKGC